MHAIMTNNMAQIFHFKETKGTFGVFERELMMNKYLLDSIHMDAIGLPNLIVDQDVIK